MASYSLAETARILQISPSRLRYWERTDLVRPQDTAGPERAFDFRDLVCLRAVVSLLDQGVPLRRIRRSVARLRERLPELEEPLGALRVWADGSHRVVVRHAGLLVEPDGQLVLDFGAARSAAVAELRAASDAGEDAPASALAWFERGSALDGETDTWDEAARAYRRCLELDPEFADAHCNLGTIHYNRGERDPAREHYEAALAIDPGHLEASFNLGNLHEEEGRREAALRHYKNAVRRDPFFPEAHLNLALLYDRLGLPRSARGHWRRYLQIVPEGPWAEIARERLDREGPGG